MKYLFLILFLVGCCTTKSKPDSIYYFQDVDTTGYHIYIDLEEYYPSIPDTLNGE